MKLESEKAIDQVLPDKLESLNFDDWKQLHEKDPVQFNYYRKLILEHQIKLAPEDIQPRLRGLLFRIDGEAARSRTALEYNCRLSEMMVELVEQLREQLRLITETQLVVTETEKPAKPSAKVIPFRSPKKQQPH